MMTIYENNNRELKLMISDRDGAPINVIKGIGAYRAFCNQLRAVIDGRISKKDMSVFYNQDGTKTYYFELPTGSYMFTNVD